MKSYFLLTILISTITCGQTLEEKIQQRVTFQETPGIVVGMYDQGKISYYAFGVADLKAKEPVTSRTLFEIGSITKTFTTSVAALLSLEQKIAFDEKAQTYLPARIVLPEKNGKSITIGHLASAHSGLPRMPGNFAPADVNNPYIDYRENELTAFLNNCELNREPGSQYEYSNLGMGLLGYIVSRIEDKPYSKLIHESIAKPLEMRHTFISGQVHDKLLATGYSGSTPVKAWTWEDASVLTGAGGIVSNAEDMMKFLVAQLNPPSNNLGKAFVITHAPKGDAGKMKIGYGWHIRDESLIWHNGGTGGFRSFAGFDKTLNKAVVILTNSNTGADDLGFHLLNEKNELKPLKKPFTVPFETLQQYVGMYELTPGFQIEISREESTLFLQATGQPKVTIYAETDSKFYLKLVEAQVEFVRNQDGVVEQLILYQNGATLPGKKIR
ncbi:MAG: serine hydrolase [Cyclobacteriaceae bacterium]|nr:serine hydrolase [Cyclobacteriaceae bacterium]